MSGVSPSKSFVEHKKVSNSPKGAYRIPSGITTITVSVEEVVVKQIKVVSTSHSSERPMTARQVVHKKEKDLKAPHSARAPGSKQSEIARTSSNSHGSSGSHSPSTSPSPSATPTAAPTTPTAGSKTTLTLGAILYNARG